MRKNTRWAILAVPLSLLGIPQASANPLDSDTATKEAAYNSPFKGYIKDEYFEAGGWVKANERVGEIGGWRTYLRQAQEPMDGSEASKNDQGAMPHSGHGSTDSSPKGAK